MEDVETVHVRVGTGRIDHTVVPVKSQSPRFEGAACHHLSGWMSVVVVACDSR